MSQNLYIVLVGAAGNKTSKGQLPELNSIITATDFAKNELKAELEIIIVDPSLNNAIESDKIKIENYPENVRLPKISVEIPFKFWQLDNQGMPPDRNNEVLEYPPLQEYKDSIPYGDLVDDIRDTPNPVIFIDYTGKNKNSYDLMEMLETANFDQRWYIVQKDFNNLYDPLSTLKLLKEKQLPDPYNLYSGLKVESKYEDEAIKYNMSIFCLLLRNYLLAGFDKKEINFLPDPWSLNLNTFALKGLLRYYDLYPDRSIEDKRKYPEREFLVNSQYREAVTDVLLKVVSNFLINNSIITIEEFNLMGGVKSVKSWVVAYRKLTS